MLFIDEMHTLVGAGKADGAMDASNLLKPALARGELHCVGATTLDEYAQARREGRGAGATLPAGVRVGAHRGGHGLDPARPEGEVRAVTTACASPIRPSSPPRRCRTATSPTAFLPDKAIDLVDEASARLRMQVDSKPEELDSIDREIVRLKIEGEALKKETGRRLEGPAPRGSRPSSPISEEQSAAITRAGRRRRTSSAAPPTSRSVSTRRARSSPRPNARASTSAPASSPTARSRSSSASSRKVEAAGGEAGDGGAEGLMEEAVHPRPRRLGRLALDLRRAPSTGMLEGERDKLLRMEERSPKRVVGPGRKPSSPSRPRCAAPRGAAGPLTGRSARSCSSAPPRRQDRA